MFGPDGFTDEERGYKWGSKEHIHAIGGKDTDTLEQAFHKNAMARMAKRLEEHGFDAGAASKVHWNSK